MEKELKPYLHKVQYYETDQMGMVHHSSYIRWFEEARVDFLDQIGLPFFMLEQKGLFSPVVSVECRYQRPVKFGQSVLVFVTLESFERVKFCFSYRITDSETGEVATLGKSSHCFLNGQGKIVSVAQEDPESYQIICRYVGK